MEIYVIYINFEILLLYYLFIVTEITWYEVAGE